MDTFPAERASIRLFRIIDRDVIQVQTTRLGCVRFFLFDVLNTISFTEIRNSFSNSTEADLCELLIGYLAKVNTTLEITIIATYYGSYAAFNAVVNDVASNLADIVLCTIVAFSFVPVCRQCTDSRLSAYSNTG